ncbi:hypothetical protein [Shewanella woodyi]|uniref:hypothetical protein n=1 Tax=Shewanella woodyi TaxID=60961 RepID=UPI0012FC89CD
MNLSKLYGSYVYCVAVKESVVLTRALHLAANRPTLSLSPIQIQVLNKLTK